LVNVPLEMSVYLLLLLVLVRCTFFQLLTTKAKHRAHLLSLCFRHKMGSIVISMLESFWSCYCCFNTWSVIVWVFLSEIDQKRVENYCVRSAWVGSLI